MTIANKMKLPDQRHEEVLEVGKEGRFKRVKSYPNIDFGHLAWNAVVTLAMYM